jgi:hypothetical protein
MMVPKLHTTSKIMGIHRFGWFTLAEADGVMMPSLALTALTAVTIHTMIVRIPQKLLHAL